MSCCVGRPLIPNGPPMACAGPSFRVGPAVDTGLLPLVLEGQFVLTYGEAEKMGCIHISDEFGIVVRRCALSEREVAWTDLLGAFGVPEPLDSNETLASFGPHFGQEALDELTRRLTNLGLLYFDDFFAFQGDFPKWITFRACIAD